ncbi:caspase family protein [Dechloromonas sp. TW-R-39-2]|uniref:caspase family protein n=1 Tax=Dechloromonas sp. TW-R-39-2 TaxID=2654218 RepID=UPI001EEFC510|nr:caspase family protein [Dechloromonas sp. TW-R-39-2]
MTIKLKSVLASILLSTSLPYTHAANHALIMGIENYERSPLHGVPKDRANARKIAKSMGVPDENIIERQEKALTLEGLRTTLKQFQKTIGPGDRVFVYFSGHGTSQSNGKNGCEQGLVTQDMQVMPKAEFHALIDPIKNVAAKTIVFLDTCFSGGVVTTSKATRDYEGDELKPKFLQPKLSMSQRDTCGDAVNYAKATRDFDDIQQAQSTPNYYLLGAAGPNEYAIDGGPVRGSFATAALLECLNPESGADQNRDGIISLEEAKICAQVRVNRMLRPPFLAQTLTAGDGQGGGATPVSFGLPPTSAPASASTPAPVPVAPNATASSPPAPGKIDSRQLLETLKRGADPKHQVTIRSAKTAYKIRQDYLDLEVTSSKPGYLTLLSVGSSGRIFQLFPNELDQKNRLEANVALRIPRPEWRVAANGPAGSNRFLAIVSGSADRFASIGVPIAGRFRAVDNTPGNVRDMVERLTAPTTNCAVATARDFDSPEAAPCGAAYGAGLIDVREVD